MRKQLLVGLIFLLLSACTIGPDYSRPPVISPAEWTVSYDAAADLTDSAWWQQFNDPVFDKLISIALTNNLDLQAAVARVDQFLGQWRTTRSEYFPQIGASASATRLDDTDTGRTLPDGPYNDYRGALSASWEIDLWGRVRRSTEAARAELLASRPMPNLSGFSVCGISMELFPMLKSVRLSRSMNLPVNLSRCWKFRWRSGNI